MTNENKQLTVGIVDDFFFDSVITGVFLTAAGQEAPKGLSSPRLKNIADQTLALPVNGSVYDVNVKLIPKDQLADALEFGDIDLGIAEDFERENDETLPSYDPAGTVKKLCRIFAAQDGMSAKGANFAAMLGQAENKINAQKAMTMQQSMSQKDVSFYAKRAMGLGNE
jgi:hypothetical protein